MKEIYQEIISIIDNGEKAALATVVGATGSTPGKESAKMLIRADGSSVGSIGGGCTEADVWALAREVIETEQPLRKSFTLTPKAAEEESVGEVELTEAELRYLDDLRNLPATIRSRIIGWMIEVVPSTGIFAYGMYADNRLFLIFGFVSLLIFALFRMYSQFRGFKMISRICAARFGRRD